MTVSPFDTIAAVSTPFGKGGVAVIRLAGDLGGILSRKGCGSAENGCKTVIDLVPLSPVIGGIDRAENSSTGCIFG